MPKTVKSESSLLDLSSLEFSSIMTNPKEWFDYLKASGGLEEITNAFTGILWI